MDSPAFPSAQLFDDGSLNTQHLGITTRDYFAAAALTGILASGNPAAVCKALGYGGNLDLTAYRIADGMMGTRFRTLP